MPSSVGVPSRWIVAGISVSWLVVIITFLVLSGFHVVACGHAFQLGDNVLVALVSGATINVLGIFLAVVLYLFPRRNPPPGG